MDKKKEFEEFFKAHEKEFLVYAFILSRNREVAEDIVAEVMVELYPKWHKVKNHRAYVYKAIRNRYISYKKRELVKERALSIFGVKIADRYEDPLEDVYKDEFLKILMEGISNLEPLEREVLILKELDNLDYESIQEIVNNGKSVNALKIILHRAKQKLKKFLEEKGVKYEDI